MCLFPSNSQVGLTPLRRFGLVWLSRGFVVQVGLPTRFELECERVQ